jgi:hypothetical protein
MTCAECGSVLVEAATCCSECGAPVDRPIRRKRIRIIWLILLGVLFLSACVSLFIPALAGSLLYPRAGYGAIIWGSLFFWATWRYRLRKGWHGGLLGAAAGVLLFVIAALINGYIRASAGS